MTESSQSSSTIRKALQITFGAFGQAVLCIFFGNAAVMLFLIALPPLLVLEAEPTGHFLLTVLGFAFVSLWAGHLFPRFASLRSALAFCFMIVIDLCLIGNGSTGVMLREESELTGFTNLVAVIGTGGIFCALAGAVGARLNRDFYGWIKEEIEEFSSSISHHTLSMKPQLPVSPLDPCRMVEPHLPMYVTGEHRTLSSEIRYMVEEHLTVCEDCQKRLKGIAAEEQHSSSRYRKSRALYDNTEA